MLQAQGYEVIEYSNEGSESSANEHVAMMTAAEFEDLYGNRNSTDFHGNDATIGSDGHKLFESRLIPAIKERLEPQDIICHPFGHAHQVLMSEFPGHQHVETGIGYPTLMPNSFRIFESYAWMHYHQGKENRNGRNYEWVIPNYYDLDDWDISLTPGSYLAFLGRITEMKGLDTMLALADHSPWPIVLHGQGDPSRWAHPNIEYRGPLTGKDRSAFLKEARALLAPTVFTEPFCGMAVEAMLCGTPVISVDYGAMTETVREGMGFRCHTLQDWVDAVNAAGDFDRQFIADSARSRYSLEACGQKYKKVFEQLNDLYRGGWYELNQISFKQIEREEGPFAERLADWVVSEIKPDSVLDVGCGPGIYVQSLLSRSVAAIGIDSDERADGAIGVKREDLFVSGRSAGLVLCLEVAEHIESERSEELAGKMFSFVRPGGFLIWSAAHPGQGGVGHINCQTKEYWEELLTAAGFARCENLERKMLDFIKSGYHMGWFAQNAVVFTAPAADGVNGGTSD